VFVRRELHDAVMKGPPETIEFFHGYTYSGHPVACAAALATLDVYAREGLLTRAAALEEHWANALHAVRDAPHVTDIRNLGLMGAIDLQPRPDAPGARAYAAMVEALKQGLLIRITGDTIALSPPLIIREAQIDELCATLRRVLEGLG
jgi:beta-alanine--pyruvate transaminase